MEREISIILKIKGAKEAKKAINDVFDSKTLEVLKSFDKNLEKTAKGMNNLKKRSDGAKKATEGFTKVLGRGMAALYLYNRAWSTFGRNFEMGLNLERAADQFERHVGRVAEMLPTLKSATRGIISDFDLLKTANRAFQQGIQPQQMGKAFSLATSAAQKLGLNASEAIRTITDALTKHSNEGALQTLGIVTDVNQAYQTQTALIAKNGGVMSKAMQIQLRRNLVLQELQKRFGGVNAAQEDGLMILERFRASWKNFRAAIGDTLGLALRPLTRALTGVLDVTTALLNRLNDTSGFKNFVQLSATLAGIWAGAKFITGARSLMSLFGLISGNSGSKMVRKLGATPKLLSKLGKVLVKNIPLLGRFLGSLGGIVKVAGNFIKTIPGIGTALAVAFTFLDPIVDGIKRAWQMGKVFFQLMGNFDENSGLSKVLKRDAEALGPYYNAVENAAKITIQLWNILKSIGSGVYSAFKPVLDLFDYMSVGVSNFASSMFTVEKIAVRSGSKMKDIFSDIKSMVERWAPTVLGALSGAIKGFMMMAPTASVTGPIGPMIGALGGAAVGGLAGETFTGITQKGPSNEPMDSSRFSRQQGIIQPRSMNLDSMESQTDLLKKNNKLLERQNQLWEKEIQDRDIEKSQNDARSNIWMRR